MEALPSVILLPPPKTEATDINTEATDTKEDYIRRKPIAVTVIKAAAVLFALAVFSSVIASGIYAVIGEGIGEIFAREVFSSSSVSVASQLDKPDTSGKPDESIESNEVKIPLRAVNHGARTVYDVYNETAYSPDVGSLLGSFVGQADRDEPTVLVIHTHATEAYRDEYETSWAISEGFRSENTDESVIAVGDAFCSALEKCGIGAVHITEQFDLPSIVDAYEKSASAVAEYLSEHPSIRYVFDIHRDALLSAECEYLAPTFVYGDCDVAEVMLVVGTDEAGAPHPCWQDNLSFALALQSTMLDEYPGLARGYNLRSASFSQQLSSGSLIVEIGSCTNTLTEAKRGAVLFALAFAETIGKAELPTAEALLSEIH